MRSFLLAASFLVTASAYAADDPNIIKGANDTRIRTVDYSDNTVTIIRSTNFVPVVITYGEGEKPSLIAGRAVVPIMLKPDASPDDQKKAYDMCSARAVTGPAWCAQKLANELTLTPMSADPGSVLVVTTEKEVTDPDGNKKQIHHHYSYELVTREGFATDKFKDKGNGDVDRNVPIDPLAYFHVQYTYRTEEAETAGKIKAAEAKQNRDLAIANARQKEAADRLALAAKVQPKNIHNWMKNDSPDCQAIGPLNAYDDGRSTVLHFAQNTPVSVPTIPVGEKEQSSITPVSSIGADSGVTWTFTNVVPKSIYLHRGEKTVCGIYNTAYDPNAKNLYTGTASPDVVRQTQGQ